MKLSSYFILFFLLFSSVCLGQTSYSIKGSVQDTSRFSLPGALVKIKSGKDSLATSADANGNFTFSNVKFQQFTLSAAFIGFQTYVKQFKNDKNEKTLHIPVIKLTEKANTLNEVVISGVPPVRVKEDTVQFNASAFKVREGDAVEEVIKKLPGVTVDKDGNVSTQGKPITKIRVNGKDFFGTDVATAIQNLPAEIVQNLQIIDDYGDQAKVTGIKSDEPEKILNINIQPDKKKGYYARGTGGLGNENRYLASARVNSFKGERQISFDGGLNNTNLRGGAVNGINNNRNAGLNYKAEWGPKFTANAGYSFKNRENTTVSSSSSQTFYSDFTRFVNSNSNNSSSSTSNNFWGNMEFMPDSLNYFKFSPNFSISGSNNNSDGFNDAKLQKIETIRDSYAFANSSSANFGSTLFYNHKFMKPGRNISLWASANFSRGDNFRDLKTDYIDIDSVGLKSNSKQYQQTDSWNDNRRFGTHFSYSEPLSKTSFVDFRYIWNYSNTRSKRDLSDVDTLTSNLMFNRFQSNNYQYEFITNRFSLNYRKVSEKYNYSLGLSAQPALLKGEDISRELFTRKETFNMIPSARFVYRVSKQQSLTVNYNGRSNQPGFSQLQPLTDSTNLRNVVIGNPDLAPEFVHGLNVDYNKSDWKSGNVFFATLSYNQTQNKIVSARVLDQTTNNQVTSYKNADGFYTVRGNYSYARSFSERKFTVTYSGAANYNNNIAFLNLDRNIAKNIALEQGLKFRLDIKDVIDSELSSSYSINRTSYSLPDFEDRNTNRLILGLNGRNYFFKDLTIGYDLSKSFNSGYQGSSIPNPTILNLQMEYRFLKGNAGALRLNAVDLFNENTGISRDVFDNEIVDSQTNRLGRYFLMSFILRLRKFG